MDIWSSGLDNPLLLSKVIQEILKHIPSHHYKEFRKINKVWNQEVCRLTQVEELVTLSTASKCEKYTKSFSRSSEIDQDFPHPHARFYFPKIRMNLIYNNYVLRRFFKQFGPQVKQLHLAFSKSLMKMKFLRILIFDSLTHLESLTLTFHNFKISVPKYLNDDRELTPLENVTELTVYGYGDEVDLRGFISKILICLPNLRRLETGDLQGRLLFDIIYGPDKHLERIPSITQMELSALGPPQIEMMIQNQLKLEVLKAELLPNVEMSNIQVLLDALALHLRELKLDFPPSTTPLSTKFPAILNPIKFLVKVELFRFEIDINMFSNAMFPVLKQLKLNLCQLSCENICIPNNTLDFLLLNVCRGLTPSIIREMAKLFPNLRTLDIKIFIFKDQEDLLKAICEGFHNMQELRINDEILTHVFRNAEKSVETLEPAKDAENAEVKRWIEIYKKIKIMRI